MMGLVVVALTAAVTLNTPLAKVQPAAPVAAAVTTVDALYGEAKDRLVWQLLE